MSGLELTPTLCATASPKARLIASPGTQECCSQTRAGPMGLPDASITLRHAAGPPGVQGWQGRAGRQQQH